MARRVIDAAVFAYFALMMVLVLLLGFRWQTQRSAPAQPIAYSHEIHVGKLNLQCLFCHETADKSTFAGVPPVSRCMECHIAVRTDRPEIQKIRWRAGSKKLHEMTLEDAADHIVFLGLRSRRKLPKA